ncbi:DUF4064 domain-containing protein [Bacillus manliponensis]
METKTVITKKTGIISYTSLIIGIICFFMVFVTPTRIAYVGNPIGDFITLSLTGIGIVLSITGIAKKTEKKYNPYHIFNPFFFFLHILDPRHFLATYWSN